MYPLKFIQEIHDASLSRNIRLEGGTRGSTLMSVNRTLKTAWKEVG